MCVLIFVVCLWLNRHPYPSQAHAWLSHSTISVLYCTCTLPYNNCQVPHSTALSSRSWLTLARWKVIQWSVDRYYAQNRGLPLAAPAPRGIPGKRFSAQSYGIPRKTVVLRIYRVKPRSFSPGSTCCLVKPSILFLLSLYLLYRLWNHPPSRLHATFSHAHHPLCASPWQQGLCVPKRAGLPPWHGWW